jgi:protein involved in polysaccharide export with SLBB domain
VQHTGEFPLQKTLTIFDALSGAGGFRDFARKNKIYILRGAQRIKFDYSQSSRKLAIGLGIPVPLL